MEIEVMKVSVGKYTLFVILVLCIIPCLLLLMAVWYALGLPQALMVVGPALLIVLIVTALGRKRPGLKSHLDGQPPASLRVGRHTIDVLRSEPDLTRGRKAYLVVAFLLWLGSMVCLMLAGVSLLDDRAIAGSLVVVVITLPLVVNHLEHRWRS